MTRPSASQSIPSAYSMAPGKKKQNMEFNIIQNDFPALPGAKANGPGQIQQQAKPASSSPDNYGQDPKYSPQQQSYQQQYPGLGQSAGAPITPSKQQQHQQFGSGSPRMLGR